MARGASSLLLFHTYIRHWPRHDRIRIEGKKHPFHLLLAIDVTLYLLAVLHVTDVVYPNRSPERLPRLRVALKVDQDGRIYETQPAAPGCDATWNESFEMYVTEHVCRALCSLTSIHIKFSDLITVGLDYTCTFYMRIRYLPGDSPQSII